MVCIGPSKEFTITVSPTAQVNPIAPITYCKGEAVEEIVFSTLNTSSATVYNWTNDNTSIGLGASGTTGIPSFIAANDTNNPVISTITVTPSYVTADPLLACDGLTETFTITVNPTADMNDPEDMIVCDEEVTSLVEFTTNNSGVVTSYSWINDTPNIGLSTSGLGNLPSFTAVNIGTEPIVVTIEVTPLFTDLINCDGISETFIITVNPSGQLTPVDNQILCNSDLTNSVIFTSDNTGGDITYTWTNDTPSIGLATIGSGDISSFIALNTSTEPVIATIEVTPNFEGCNGTPEIFTITVNGNVDPNPTISNYNGFQISCFGANDGFINLLPEGATPNINEPFYQFEWVGPNGFISSNQNISNLEPGTYNVIIADSLNCLFEFDYEIAEPESLEIVVDQEINVLCNGIFDAQISITPTGGSASYIYEWTKDGLPYSDQQDLNNLSPGVYILYLYDSNNCGSVSEIFEITESAPIESNLDSSVDILCFGAATGSINITVLEGNPFDLGLNGFQYIYQWNGPSGYFSNEEDISNLLAGIYDLLVTDSAGCQMSFQYELLEPEDLVINYISTNNSCYESNDGTISVEITGGVEPYSIYWSNLGNGPIQTNLSTGDYEVIVTDFNECQESIVITIDEAPLFDINPIINDISCYAATDGSINLNISGGVEPMSVTWDDDPTAGDERNNLLPGTYSVLIIDSSGNNCSITQSFVILEPQELSLSSIIGIAIDCEIGSSSIDLQVTGGTSPYTFQWNNGSVSEDLANIVPGNYSVSVVDDNGCEIVEDFSIDIREDIIIGLDISFEIDCENDIPYQITTINIEGGVAPYDVIWSSGVVSEDNNETMISSQNGTVVVNVIDFLGCESQVIFDIDLFDLGSPGFNYSSPGLTECEMLGVGDIIQFNNTSTGDYISIDWNFGDTGLTVINQENPTHIYTQPGTYVVTQTVYYEYGCVDVFEETLYVTDGYALVLPNAFTPNGDGINDTIRPWFKCMTNVEISIYDTFGSLLYVESGEDIYGWDGSINGKLAENGNYIIVVVATTLFGEIINLNGPITLIR